MQSSHEVIIIAGEIHNNNVVFLIITESQLSITVYINNEIYSSFHICTIATRLLLPFVDNNRYVFTTSQGVVISEHNLTDHYKQLTFFSCDMPSSDTIHSLFNNFQSQQGLCFHIGDNIYGDRAYNSINHTYKDIYITTWQRWSKLMSNFSHMMIADDHEVADGFDIKLLNKSSRHLENYNNNPKLREALTCYHNFQTSLRYNPDFGGFFVKKVDDLTTAYIISGSMLDVLPIQIIRKLKDGGNFRNNIIITTSTAPIPLTDNIPYEQIFGGYGWNSEHLLELYDICFELLESGKVTNIILIGGDLHFGISGVIKKGPYKIYIYITSGITAHPTPVERMLALSMNGEFMFGKYNIHLTSKANRNYLTIQLPIKQDDPGTITYSDEYWPKSVKEYLIDMAYIIKPKVPTNFLDTLTDITEYLST